MEPISAEKSNRKISQDLSASQATPCLQQGKFWCYGVLDSAVG